MDLLPLGHYDLIRRFSSGERALGHFSELSRFSGFAPSAGAERVADYLAAEAQSIGLENVSIERYSSDGASYTWAFRNEPYWEGRRGSLWLISPESEELADFGVTRTVLARNSRTTECTAPLVDVGRGDDPADYEGRSVAGAIVLASGDASHAMRLAVWERKALGVVVFRTARAVDFPDQIGVIQLVPWEGPNLEAPTFAFSLSNRCGRRLQERLAAGETLMVHATVEADTGTGSYAVVSGSIPGTDPTLPAIVFNAHDNARNTGGANNLTGVGCTLEVARLLNHLISTAALPRPRRTIRFMWGAEHYGVIQHFHAHPEDVVRILAIINVDMIGFNQQTSGAVAHLYRSPYSNPSFLDDIIQSFMERLGVDNSMSIRNFNILAVKPSDGFSHPIFAPTGSQEQYRYTIEPFWGPSDQEDTQALGLPTAYLGDFPDIFLATQDDTLAATDATQMRRGVVLASAAAYFLASAGKTDTATLLLNATLKAISRFSGDEIKAYEYIKCAGADDFLGACGEAANVMAQALIRETKALCSLERLIQSADFTEQAKPFHADLLSAAASGQRRLKSFASERAEQLNLRSSASGVPKLPPDADAVPVRIDSLRGPVNLFRLEYGRWWLIDKTGDQHFERQLGLARRGFYTAYEALNFADGTRSLLEIRDAVSAEFSPVPLCEVTEYFRFLEGCGIVHFNQKKC